MKRHNFILCTLMLVAPVTLLPVKASADYQCLPRDASLEQLKADGFVERLTFEDASWMVNISDGTFAVCGGVLINKDMVLTAAHCFDKLLEEKITVRTADEQGRAYGQSKRTVGKPQIHPDYDPASGQHDLALLLLENPMDIDYNIRDLIILPPSQKDLWAEPGDCAKVMGWGRRDENKPESQTLLATNIPIWSNQDCEGLFEQGRISENTLCAGYSHGEYDSCQGDSGGPLLVAADWGDWLIGIVSSGRGCGREDAPGIYSRLSDEDTYNWIFATTQEMRRTQTIEK
ncbi:MAG: serine protease [Aquisalinus sp.]|nr:serine protease [Aquisalinus sp.]